MSILASVWWAYGPLLLLGCMTAAAAILMKRYVPYAPKRWRLILTGFAVAPVLFPLYLRSVGVVAGAAMFVPAQSGIAFFVLGALIGMLLAELLDR